MAATGENITGAVCALAGNADDMKVVYLIPTLKPAQLSQPEVVKTLAYVFDMKSGQALVTKEMQPPTPDLKLAESKDWKLASTATGVAWIDAFTDGHNPAAPPRTVVLTSNDLSILWSDPQPAQVYQDVLAFQRNTTPGKTAGAELRLSKGDPIFQDNDVYTVDSELYDGPDKLVKLTRWDSYNPPAQSTMFYDLNAKAPLKIGDSDKVSGGGLTASLSNGKLFIDGRNSEKSQFGFGVWNLRTQQWDLLKSRDDATKMSISKLEFFSDHLYITKIPTAYSVNTYSVIALPATDPVASAWSVRPFARISGWTLVCRGETSGTPNGECRDIVMVQDQDGHFPGPWY